MGIAHVPRVRERGGDAIWRTRARPGSGEGAGGSGETADERAPACGGHASLELLAPAQAAPPGVSRGGPCMAEGMPA